MELSGEITTKYTDSKSYMVSCSSEKDLPFGFSKNQHHIDMANEWIYSDIGKCIRLEYYKGKNENILIPNKICNKPTKIRAIDDSVIPNIKSLKSFRILCNENGEKIGIEKKSLLYAFKNCDNLEIVDLTGLDTSKVTNMYGMFFGCYNLKMVNLNGLDTGSVKDMRNMFANCISLQSLDIRHFNLGNLVYADNMFFNNFSLRLLRMDEFDSQVLDISKIFTYFLELSDIPLLLVTNDQRLLNYEGLPGYPINRIPLSTPIFDANGGIFENGTDKKYYFEKVINTTIKIRMEVFEQFKKDNIPKKEGFIFDGWDVVSEDIKYLKNSDDMLHFKNAIYQAKWKSCFNQDL